MKFLRKDQSGFGLVELTTVIAVVSIIVIGGGVLYRHHKQHFNSSPSGSHLPVQSGMNNSKQTEKTSQDLIIKEWNIRVTLPQSLSGDITYAINDQAAKDFGGPVRVDLMSKHFSAGNLKCSDIENAPRVLVSFYKEIDGEGGVTQDPQPFKTIDNTRYYFAPTSCEEAINRSGSAEDKQLLAGLKNAVVTTLEATKQ